MLKSQIKIFLIEPVDTSYKKIIIYSDNCKNARRSTLGKHNANILEGNSINDIQLVLTDNPYVDDLLSTCIQIDPYVVAIDEKKCSVKIKYQEFEYHLFKDKPRFFLEGGIPL
jgi:hypothetical protein